MKEGAKHRCCFFLDVPQALLMPSVKIRLVLPEVASRMRTVAGCVSETGRKQSASNMQISSSRSLPPPPTISTPQNEAPNR
jgi:hypothetical protein